MKNEMMSVTEAAERLGVSRNTINNYYKSGKLPYQTINNRAYFTVSDVEALRPGTQRVTTYLDKTIDEIIDEKAEELSDRIAAKAFEKLGQMFRSGAFAQESGVPQGNYPTQESMQHDKAKVRASIIIFIMALLHIPGLFQKFIDTLSNLELLEAMRVVELDEKNREIAMKVKSRVEHIAKTTALSELEQIISDAVDKELAIAA